MAFVNLSFYLNKILHKKVDLVTNRALKPQLKDKILEDIRTSNDGHTVFNFQSNDLSTSLGGVEIYYEIYENEDDKYANITISDNYNFELDLAYENIVTAIGNNIAVVSEGINDLNSFGITIKLTNVKFDDEN